MVEGAARILCITPMICCLYFNITHHIKPNILMCPLFSRHFVIVGLHDFIKLLTKTDFADIKF